MEPKAPQTCGGEAPTARSEFFTTNQSASLAANLPANAPPLADVLLVSAQHVRAVLDGQSLSARLDESPAPLRSAVQAVSFHAMRRLGLARAVYAALVERPRPQSLDHALLLVALTLLDAAIEARNAVERPRGVPLYAVHTIVDQAVDACAQHPALRGHKRFINAVLRNFLRQRDALLPMLSQDPQARWNFPHWWIEQVQADYPAQWQDLLAAADTPAPMTLRINRRRQTVAGLLAALEAHGIAGQAVGEAGVVLSAPQPVHSLPGFAQGWWSVQDAAAQLAAPLLAPRDGMRVLDACAAPGGKTAHLLELADVHLQALDADDRRLARVQQNLDRLGLASDRVTLTCADAARPHTWWDGQPFDAILVDAPCTASGVVRRHPDIRWLRRADDLPRTAALQRRIADALWPLLRPGGRLLYVTCSVFPQEGQAQAHAFEQRWHDAQRLPAPGQLLPLAQDGAPAGDGFFYALFGKETSAKSEQPTVQRQWFSGE